MSKVEIISLIVSIIALVSLCAVFTIFLINFCKKSISDIKLGRQDEDIIISEIERRRKEQSKNSKIRKVFNWKPLWNVYDSVAEVVLWSKNYYHNNDVREIMDNQIKRYSCW